MFGRGYFLDSYLRKTTRIFASLRVLISSPDKTKIFVKWISKKFETHQDKRFHQFVTGKSRYPSWSFFEITLTHGIVRKFYIFYLLGFNLVMPFFTFEFEFLEEKKQIFINNYYYLLILIAIYFKKLSQVEFWNHFVTH